jgi:hypothetical protein
MNIEDLLENSGVANKAPPGPNGTPYIRNALAIIRWPVRVLVLPFVWLDLAAQKIARLFIPTPFVRAGKCKKRVGIHK